MLRILLLGIALLAAVAGDEPGLSGYVLAPDGTPVSSGRVVIQSFGPHPTASIDETGRFRVIPNAAGPQVLVVSVPGFAPYRVNVGVPRSKTVKLPVIRLSPATYFRVRFVSAAGEPILSPRLYRRSFDASGPVSVPMPEGVSERIDGDGAITVGPLPRGITTFALDTPPFARTRLADITVTSEKPLLDGGTVIVQPGAVLHVDVVDENGVAVPQHDVSLEDVRPWSPLGYAPVRTNQEGRATFERLAAGRYRVRTAAIARCGNELLTIATVVPVPAGGAARTRLVVDGHATFRITSPLGPLRGIRVSALPDPGPPPPAIAMRPRFDASPLFGSQFRETSCAAGTDAEGRVTLTHFPPGPARIDVRLVNSSYVRRVDVPLDGREIALVMPEGFLPVRAVSAADHDPIARAAISWTSEGARVEATASVVGEALLEGVGLEGGTLAVAAAGYKSVEEKLTEPPAVLHDVALERMSARNIEVRVVTASGQPLADAVVGLTSLDPMEIPCVEVTDAKGSVTFRDAPPGSLRLTVSADGSATVAASVPADGRTGIMVTLTRASQ